MTSKQLFCLQVLPCLPLSEWITTSHQSFQTVSGLPMTHFLYNTLEDLTFSECESRSVWGQIQMNSHSTLPPCPGQAVMGKEEGRELVVDPFAWEALSPKTLKLGNKNKIILKISLLIRSLCGSPLKLATVKKCPFVPDSRHPGS